MDAVEGCRAMDGPSDRSSGEREKRRAPDNGFTVVRREAGGVLSLLTFFARAKKVRRAAARNSGSIPGNQWFQIASGRMKIHNRGTSTAPGFSARSFCNSAKPK